MKQILRFYSRTPLVLRIVIGMFIGFLCGLWLPEGAPLGVLGTVFTGALKGIAPLLVFFLVIASLSSAGEGLGSRFRTVILLYLISTLMASLVAVAAVYLFPVAIPLDAAAGTQDVPAHLGDVFAAFFGSMVENPIAAIANGNYISILSWAILLGLALKKVGNPAVMQALTALSDAVSTVVRWIIQLAPFGIMGLVYTSVSKAGTEIFRTYGSLLLLLCGSMLAVALIVNPCIVGLLLRKNPYPLVFRCLRVSGVSAFFTRSSAANIPVNLRLCESLGLDRDYCAVAIPLGATINMDGAAVTITVMSLTAAFSQGMEIHIVMAILLSIVSTLGACGASGVTGGSLLLIPMACSLLGVSGDVAMQMVSIGFIIGVVQDSLETAVNSSGDVLFCAAAEFLQYRKQGRDLRL